MKDTRNISVRTWMFLVVGVLETVLFSSNMLGWSSLLFVLKKEGYFHDLCQTSYSNSTVNTSDASTATLGLTKRGCVAQDEQFSLVVTLTSGIGNGATVLVGIALDRLGAKTTRVIASLGYGLSATLFAVATKDTAYLLFPAAVLSHTTGMTLFFCACRATVVFGRWQPTATGLMNGANIGSAVTYLIFQIIYENFGVAYHSLFYGLMVCSGMVLLNTFILYPDLRKEHVATKKSDESEQTIEKKTLTEEILKGDQQGEKTSLSQTETPLWKLLISGGVIWSIVLMGFCRLRLWFFVASFHHFMWSVPGASESTVKAYSDIYAIAQLCAIACGPFLGLIISAGKGDLNFCKAFNRWTLVLLRPMSWSRGQSVENVKEVAISLQVDTSDPGLDEATKERIREIRGCQVSIICTAVTLIAFGVLVLIPSIPLQILSFAMLVSSRVFNQGAITNMLLVMYPTKHFGTLLGIISFTVAMICLLQHPIFIIMESFFDGHPFWVHAFLLVASLSVIGFPFYLKYYSRRLQSGSEESCGQRSYNTVLKLQHETEVLERLTVV